MTPIPQEYYELQGCQRRTQKSLHLSYFLATYLKLDSGVFPLRLSDFQLTANLCRNTWVISSKCKTFSNFMFTYVDVTCKRPPIWRRPTTQRDPFGSTSQRTVGVGSTLSLRVANRISICLNHLFRHSSHILASQNYQQVRLWVNSGKRYFIYCCSNQSYASSQLRTPSNLDAKRPGGRGCRSNGLQQHRQKPVEDQLGHQTSSGRRLRGSSDLSASFYHHRRRRHELHHASGRYMCDSTVHHNQGQYLGQTSNIWCIVD